MNGYYKYWNYDRFLTYDKMTELKKPYICRIVPSASDVCVEIKNPTGSDILYLKERYGSKTVSKKMLNGVCVIEGLDVRNEYTVYVENQYGKSDERLLLADDVIGSVVNYLHPDDRIYCFSGNYLCSPSIVRLGDDSLLCSMDVYRETASQNLTLIFKSVDNGKTWRHLTELMPCFWGKMFCVNNVLYMLSVSTEYGDLQIGSSLDGGKTWSAPSVIARGGGINGFGWHRGACCFIRDNGKIYTSVEYWFPYANMILYADENSDLTDPDSWTITEHFVHEIDYFRKRTWYIEGNVVKSPAGDILNIVRYKENEAVMLRLNHEKNTLEYVKNIKMPVAHSKFEIIRHSDGKYYVAGNKAPGRNVLSLYVSEDLEDWKFVKDIVNCSDMDINKIGFQYPSVLIEGDEFLIASRTAYNGADNFHDSNYITFHTVTVN